MQELIKDFWSKNIGGITQKFDFEKFFNEFIKLVESKLARHGRLPFKYYLKEMESYYNLESLRDFVHLSKYSGLNITYEHILENVFLERYNFYKKKFEDSKIYDKIFSIYLELLGWRGLVYLQRVILVDKCIHLQHNSGFIAGIDIEKLRKTVEEKDGKI